MKGRNDWTIVFVSGDTRYKLARILFGADGSFFVSCPYRDADTAHVSIVTINYARDEQTVLLDETVPTAAASDSKRAIKLSHHPDGFVQFSGPGITSGRNEDGSPKRMGLMSWTHERPASGPSFGLTVRGFDEFEVATAARASDITFEGDSALLVPEPYQLHLEGYFFPALWRRFVRSRVDGTPGVSIAHPTGAILDLRALLPRAADRPFLGVELYSTPVDEGAPYPGHGFMLASSTGNLRKNEAGELLGDELVCVVPADAALRADRNLDFVPP